MMTRQGALTSLVVALIAAGAAAPAAGQADGKQVFVEQKCTRCHSAPGVKGGKRNLTGVGSKYTAEWLTSFLLKKQPKDGKKHRVTFKADTETLNILVKWLSTL